MIILGNQRDEAISKLRLTTNLARLTRGESVHPELDDCCRVLEFCLEPEDFSPSGLDVIPLWEGHSSITGFYLSEGKPTFIFYEVEDIDEFRILGTTLNSVVEDLLSQQVDELLEPEEIDELRSLLTT